MGETGVGQEGDRMERAGRYVLGLMGDEERERAERDLEIDPAFREAMMEIAERMHVFDRMPPPDDAARDDWRQIKEKIDAMPQMRPAPRAEPEQAEPRQSDPAATFGRRRSDKLRPKITPTMPARTIGTGLQSVPGNRALVLALFLAAAFALGYLAGVASAVSSR